MSPWYKKFLKKPESANIFTQDSRLRNLEEDGLYIGDFSFNLPLDWIAFPGIWGIEESLNSFLGGLRIPEDFRGTRSPGISLETERFIGADFSRNSSYIGLDCFVGWKKSSYSLTNFLIFVQHGPVFSSDKMSDHTSNPETVNPDFFQQVSKC